MQVRKKGKAVKLSRGRRDFVFSEKSSKSREKRFALAGVRTENATYKVGLMRPMTTFS